MVRSALLFLVFIGLLGGCRPVVVQRVDGGVPVSVRVDDAAYWLEEWARARALPDDELLKTLEDREREYAEAATVKSGLRLALLLAEGPRPVRNQSRALELIKGLDLESSGDSARALAGLLQQVIEEQQWSAEKMVELKTQATAYESRVQELERQLQELTDIEQTIQQRH
jgi:hypothetical protein